MKYRDYTAADFANDSFFIEWIKRPDEESEWFWSSFIADNPQCREEIQKAEKIVASLHFPEKALSDDDLNRMRQRLLLSLRAEKEQMRDLRPRRFSVRTVVWLKVAASVLLIPFLFFGIQALRSDATEASAWFIGNTPQVEERVNPSGQKSVLFLSDGTKVWLNAASRLTYKKDFAAGNIREVHLEGEAFFDVAHDKEKPFIVNTSSIKIKVLGTSFNVKSYAGEKTIETTLVDGKVSIEGIVSNDKGIGDVELRPNQRAVFNKESQTININEVQADYNTAWKQDRMVFMGESMDDVLLQLERSFDVKIHVADKGNLNCKLTASIEQESLEEVLKLLEVSHDIRYSVEGSDVFIRGRLCKGITSK